jgi:hypothetical protein
MERHMLNHRIIPIANITDWLGKPSHNSMYAKIIVGMMT